MSITRKSLILDKYTEFYNIIKSDFPEELALFPSLDEIDVADLSYFLTLSFLGVNDRDGYTTKIKELSEMNGVEISDDKFEKVVELTTDFITWLRSI